MSERALQKRLLVERVQANRELLVVEADALRARFGSAKNLLQLGAGLVQPLGAVAATAGVAGVRRAGAGAVGIAALVPVVLAVARLAAAWGGSTKRKRAAAGATDQADEHVESTTPSPGAPESEPA